MGKSTGTRTLSSPAGPVELAFALPPVASVGRLPLPASAMIVFDLNALREVAGVDVRGILGMDFLSKYAVHLDFERGRLLLLRRARRDAGHRFPLRAGVGVPRVLVRLLEVGPPEWFVADTGCGGPSSGSIAGDTYQLLLQFHLLVDAGKRTTTTAAGTGTRTVARLARLTIGPFEHRGLCFTRDASLSRLGLAFWSRYIVTFDFPAGVVYLRRGSRPDLPDDLDASGLRLIGRQGRTIVDSIARRSPAARAGIRKGDEVVSVDGRKSVVRNLSALNRLLCDEGRTLLLVVRRGEEVRRVRLHLETDWRTAKPDHREAVPAD
jgi:hypothetical protein